MEAVHKLKNDISDLKIYDWTNLTQGIRNLSIIHEIDYC